MLRRIVVIDLPDDDSPALALVNPRIVEHGPQTKKFEEGCLSIPGVSAPVERYTHVVVEACSPSGDPLRVEANGELADCVQHELDHLDGVLYIDRLSPLQRQLVLGRYRKLSARKKA